jgi:hypothetical protein
MPEPVLREGKAMIFIENFSKYHNLLRQWLARPRVRFVALTAYYLGILAGLLALYGRGDFSTPPFIYQYF